MGYIRIIQRAWYDPELKRFTSFAFQPSSDKSGISVIDIECATRTGSSICEHIRKLYPKMAGSDPIFWPVPIEQLPSTYRIDSGVPTSDPCHQNILGVSEKES